MAVPCVSTWHKRCKSWMLRRPRVLDIKPMKYLHASCAWLHGCQTGLLPGDGYRMRRAYIASSLTPVAAPTTRLEDLPAKRGSAPVSVPIPFRSLSLGRLTKCQYTVGARPRIPAKRKGKCPIGCFGLGHDLCSFVRRLGLDGWEGCYVGERRYKRSFSCKKIQGS
jgi:hypothetical protein